jgi:hypothetical protein
MSAQLKRSFVAALMAPAVLLVAHWFDAGVLVDAQRQAGHTYDPAPLMDLMVRVRPGSWRAQVLGRIRSW